MKRPYYIFTTHYNASAGIKALHRLCHELNLRGFPAFIVLTKLSYRKPLAKVNSLTPILTTEIFKKHLEMGLEPIGIYHELIEGNKFGLPLVVRYMLQFETPKKINTYSKGEILFTYSHALMASMPNPNFENILFIPVANTEVFTYQGKSERKGTCFYASKFKKRGGKLNSEINNNTSFEITRYGNKSPSQEEIAKIFQKSELFYSYEDTTLALEAVLCGCPVVFIPNEIFSDLHLAKEEVGIDGYALNPSKEEIERAKETILKGMENLHSVEENLAKSIQHFIELTQNHKVNLKPNYDLLQKHLKKLI